MNIQKSIAFLFTNYEPFEKKIRKIILTIPANKTKQNNKKNKSLGMNLTKKVEDFCNEMYRTPKKQLKMLKSGMIILFNGLVVLKLLKWL